MKALTLWQPWASLMATVDPATGRPWKSIETRSWSTKYRGPLLICAAARKPPTTQWEDGPFDDIGAGERCHQYGHNFDPDTNKLVDGWWISFGPEHREPEPLPLGVALVLVDLVEILPMVHWFRDEQLAAGIDEPCIEVRGMDAYLWPRDVDGGTSIDAVPMIDEEPFGDYAPGRFGWVTENPRILAEPIPVKGKQGLWTPDAALMAHLALEAA